MALRADWQQQLLRCQKELGFRRVRFHGILCDDMGTLMCENDQLVYSFFNADQICDFLVGAGLRPFMELSFMPSTLSSGDDTVFHYRANVTPPKDYQAWGTLIKKLTQHWVNRYGAKEVRQWFFEIWNEPNLKAFWTGTREEYFKLYEVSVEAIKSVDPELRVGGPATANNEWVIEFKEFCESKKIPVDFISTHHYPTDSFGKPGDNTIQQLAASHRSVLKEQTTKVKYQAKELPVYYTEWCTSSNPFDDLHDQPYAAAFICKTIMEARGLVQGYSYWTFSDIFEENYFSSQPFHGGFGLLNIYGVPKPSYRAFQLLHGLGDQIFQVDGEHPTVDCWITFHKKASTVKILLTNWALPTHPIEEENISLNLENLPKLKGAKIERIDSENANAHASWEKMGKPESLSPQQVTQLEKKSQLLGKPLPYSRENDFTRIRVQLPVQSTALITLELK